MIILLCQVRDILAWNKKDTFNVEYNHHFPKPLSPPRLALAAAHERPGERKIVTTNNQKPLS